jgi:putative hydrolase of the HAD superfamily
MKVIERMIETFLFDMGNVLIHFSHERMCRQMAEICGLTPADVRRLLFDSGVQGEFEKGRITEQSLHAQLEQQAQRTLDFDALVHAASDIFERNTAIEPVIEALKSQERRLVLLSNTSLPHFRFVRERFDVLSAFDAYVVSYEVGAMKPDREIFEAALAAAGCPAGNCFYTDDIAEYVTAGRLHGLQAEVYTSVDSLRVQLRDRGVTC